MSTDIDTIEAVVDRGDLEAARRIASTIAIPADPTCLWRLARAYDLHLDEPDKAEQPH